MSGKLHARQPPRRAANFKVRAVKAARDQAKARLNPAAIAGTFAIRDRRNIAGGQAEKETT